MSGHAVTDNSVVDTRAGRNLSQARWTTLEQEAAVALVALARTSVIFPKPQQRLQSKQHKANAEIETQKIPNELDPEGASAAEPARPVPSQTQSTDATQPRRQPQSGTAKIPNREVPDPPGPWSDEWIREQLTEQTRLAYQAERKRKFRIKKGAISQAKGFTRPQWLIYAHLNQEQRGYVIHPILNDRFPKDSKTNCPKTKK